MHTLFTRKGWMHAVKLGLIFFAMAGGMLNLNAQNIVNPSFEAPSTSSSSVPPSWTNCGGSPDVQIINGSGQGIFGVNVPPSHGSTYMGMVTTNNQAYQEAMGQACTLAAGVPLTGSIDLFYTNGHTNWNGNGRLHIYGGSSCGVRNELLFDSGTITNLTSWQNYPISFVPTMNHSYIVFVNYMNNGTGQMNYFCMDNFRLSSILPLELASLEAVIEGEQVQLDWELSTFEEGLFQVEWSKDGEHFSELGSVESRRGQLEYQWVHPGPVAGMNHYRLRTRDQNGQEHWSEIAQVKVLKNSLLDIYPNPVAGKLNLALDLQNPGQVDIQISDVNGKIHLHRAEHFSAGRQELQLNVGEQLSAGFYHLSLKLGHTSIHKSFVVQ